MSHFCVKAGLRCHLILVSVILYVQCGVNNIHMLDGTDLAEVVGSDVFFEVIIPQTLSYSFRSRPAKGFANYFNVTMFGVKLVPVTHPCGCSRYTNEEDVEGAVALIERGECSFVSKAVQAEKSGAVAAFIMDNDINNDGHLVEMVEDHTGREVEIPVSFISGKDGHMIKQTLERLELPYAIINVPVNITRDRSKANFPPWLVW